MNDASVYALRPGWRLQWEEAQGRHVLLYPEGMVQLNASAGAILEHLDGERDVRAIITALRERFPEGEGLEDDVREFLAEALAQGWIRQQEAS